ncbi:3-hydroxyacyl-CoA dehydrogenase family protein [Nonomuraea sp. JJY05]|jgi:3-hydroxybutyryl-CoA dehydrogenase|uniref:3-hydroxyacyl-CoA dehydrogenase family protein n=1 Tax=Nonomuraea sp. JJY05 TaxID=3350255 RepID=UPI00373F5AAA
MAGTLKTGAGAAGAERADGTSPGETPDSFGPVGVVGAGEIGVGVAADLALHGFRVVLTDEDRARLAAAATKAAEIIRIAPMLRPGFPAAPPAAAEAVTFVTGSGELAGCRFVIENVTERREAKRAAHRALDAVLPEDTVVAVNTSSIPIGEIASETSRAEHMIGMHFMNPPYLTSAVEVMRPAAASARTLGRVETLARLLRKKTIVVGDFPGFVSNRISHVFFNEAARVVAEHGVPPEIVDQVFRDCFGHRMGPLRTADLIGLDTVVDTLDRLREATGDPRFDSCALLRSMVGEGRLGRKTASGFYTYE